jgi:hypothetical protein
MADGVAAAALGTGSRAVTHDTTSEAAHAPASHGHTLRPRSRIRFRPPLDDVEAIASYLSSYIVTPL